MEHHPTWIDNLLSELPGSQLKRPLYGSYALLSEDPKTDTAIIFLHGFLGDAYGTWIDFQRMIDSPSKPCPDYDLADLFFVQYSSFRQSIADIATLVLNLVPPIFPSPPPRLFQIDFPVPGVPKSVIDLSLTPHKYKKLFLVAHSEGGAVLRRAVLLACQKNTLQTELRDANMNLFAPAHLGFEPKGWIGACLSVGRIERLALTVLNLSPAFVEMEKKTVLKQTADSTKTYVEQKPGFKALRPRVLFGEHDNVVARGEFTYDYPMDPEPGEDHVSICKPRSDYPKPLTFAIGK